MPMDGRAFFRICDCIVDRHLNSVTPIGFDCRLKSVSVPIQAMIEDGDSRPGTAH